MKPSSSLPLLFLLVLYSVRAAMAQQYVQQAYVKASNAGMADVFGQSVSISGDTMVVGAWTESSDAVGVNGDQNNDNAGDSGAAYVFVRNGGVWTQQAYLKASNSRKETYFGASVAISGDTIVVGAPGESSKAKGVNGDETDLSAPQSGAAFVFVRRGTAWTQEAYLKASNTDAGDSFGWPLAISGDTIVVGATEESSNAKGVNGNQNDNSAPRAGAAYVFVRDGAGWRQQAYLKASNTETLDAFSTGLSGLAISGDTIVAGAAQEKSAGRGVNGNQEDNTLIDAGAAYVFVRNGETWTQQAYLKASNSQSRQLFGAAAAISGDTIVIGGIGDSSGARGVDGDGENSAAPQSGAAWVFVRSHNTWTQQAYLKSSNSDAGDWFGWAVAISGNVVAIAANTEDGGSPGVNGDQADNSAKNSGAAYLFQREGNRWKQTAYLKASNPGGGSDPGGLLGDRFGESIALSGSTVVTGAIWEASSATGINGNQNDNSLTASGAAYIFSLTAPSALDQWRSEHFGSIANSGNGADFADPDHDGLTNLLEFATAHNPLQPEATVVSILPDGNFLEFRYFRNKAALTEVRCTVEWNDSLSEGSWSSSGVGEDILADDGAIQQVRAGVPAGAAGRRFVRLRASLLP